MHLTNMFAVHHIQKPDFHDELESELFPEVTIKEEVIVQHLSFMRFLTFVFTGNWTQAM